MRDHRPRPRVEYDRSAREYVIVVVLEPEEAEGIALQLDSNDAGGRELLELAEEARALNERRMR